MDITERFAKCLTNQEIKAKLVKPDSLFGTFKVGEIYDAYYIAPSIFWQTSSFDVFDGNMICNFDWEEFFKYFEIEGDFDGVECIELSLSK